MKDIQPKDTALLVHIGHSKPIEMNEFVSSLNALNGLYSSYVKKNGDNDIISKSKLYVEKIKQGSIDIYLCEIASAALIPFAENVNIIFEFASYIKKVYDFFAYGHGEKPDIDAHECQQFSDTLNIVSSDPNGTMEIGVVNKINGNIILNGCNINFPQGNSAQNLLSKEIKSLKEEETENNIYRRVLMQIYQVRKDSETKIGNKAIIDDIIKGKNIPVLFENESLRDMILFSETNPTQKAYYVDVKLMTIAGKPKAYKVIGLHETIDLDD